MSSYEAKGRIGMFAIRHLIPKALHAIVHMVFLGTSFAVIAVLAGYAVGLTTLVSDVLRGAKDLETAVVKGVEGK
jgi:hypothetical protein